MQRAKPKDAAVCLERRRLLLAGPLLGAVGAANVPAAAEAATSAGAVAAPPAIFPPPPRVPAVEGMAKLSDVDLYYSDTGGEGPAVVLLHPQTGSGLVWAYQQPVLAKAGYRVVSYSRRGFAYSGAGPRDRTGTGANDLHQLVDVLKIDRFHAVSTAAGAFVALDFALSYPERLLSLTLSCSTLNLRGGAFDALAAGLLVPGFQAMPAYFRELSPTYRAANPEGAAAWRDLEAKSFADARVVQAYENQATLAALAGLKVRALLIYGDADLLAPPPMGRLFAAAIPGSRLEILSECGHSAYWERPDVFNRAVLEFITQPTVDRPGSRLSNRRAG